MLNWYVVGTWILLFLFATTMESQEMIEAKKKYGEEIIRKFRQKIPLQKKGYYEKFNLVCNCTTACSSVILKILGNDYKDICITNGACVKQVMPDHSISVSCRPANIKYDCRSTKNQNQGIACCEDYSFCNEDLIVSVGDINSQVFNVCSPAVLGVAALFFVPIILALLFLSALVKQSDRKCSFWIFKQLCQHRNAQLVETQELIHRPFLTRASRLFDRLTSSFSDSAKTELSAVNGSGSGSGSGLPGLMQRTIARQVQLSSPIGTGRFGEVWLGSWRGEAVAVKLFSTRDERSWQREVEIYETTWLRHPNILTYIASDSRDVGMALQLWLITEYHEFGSLYDYLRTNKLTPKALAVMIRSIASGLSFLHIELENSSHSTRKPAIAHRDIKSRNILVKSDLSCTIADFGLAVKFENGKVDLPNNAKCGTTRYLSPELLADNYDLKDFEFLKMSDVYAMALVMWELLRRCEINGQVSDYEVPYFDCLPREPSLDDMKECVLNGKRRPIPCQYWKDNFFTTEVNRLICECWTECPTHRLTAFSVRIAIDRLIAYYGWNNYV